MPKLVIKQGFWQRQRHFPKLNTWAVVVSWRRKGANAAIRNALHTTMAQQKLHLLKTHKPEAWAELSQQIQNHEVETRRGLRKYCLHSRSKHRLANVLAVKIFGNMPMVKTGKRSKLDPAKLGIMQYGPRGKWQDEATQMLVAMSKKGPDCYLAEIQKQRRAAFASINYTNRKKWGREHRLALGRAQARAELLDAQYKKARALKTAFCL